MASIIPKTFVAEKPVLWKSIEMLTFSIQLEVETMVTCNWIVQSQQGSSNDGDPLCCITNRVAQSGQLVNQRERAQVLEKRKKSSSGQKADHPEIWRSSARRRLGEGRVVDLRNWNDSWKKKELLLTTSEMIFHASWINQIGKKISEAIWLFFARRRIGCISDSLRS